MRFELGDTIAGYLLAELLGEGGSGRVYRAEKDGESFAVKIPRTNEETSELETRFFQEAELLCELRHPNLVRGIEYGEEDGIPIFVLEYIPGSSIHPIAPASSEKSLARTSSELTELVQRVEQVALGLDYLHQEGIVHRDVKPENILLDAEGRARLLDLGIAKVFAERSITDPGRLVGTLCFLSPEQSMSGRVPVDERSDIYSLGVSLYWWLTGELPFDGSDTEQILHRILLGDYVPLRKRASWIPRDLASIVEKCLQLDPNDRYVSARELQEDLFRFRSHQAVYAKTVPRHRVVLRRARRRVVPILLILVFLLIGDQWRRAQERLREDWIEVSFVELAGMELALTIDLHSAERLETPGFSGRRVSTGKPIRLPPNRHLEIRARSGAESQSFSYILLPFSEGRALPLGWRGEPPQARRWQRIPGSNISVATVPVLIDEVTSVLEGPWKDRNFSTAGPGLRVMVQSRDRDPATTPIEVNFVSAMMLAASFGARLPLEEDLATIAATAWDETSPLDPDTRAQLKKLLSPMTSILLVTPPTSWGGVMESRPNYHQRIWADGERTTSYGVFSSGFVTQVVLIRDTPGEQGP